MKKGNQKEMERRQTVRLEKTLPVKLGVPDVSIRGDTIEALSRNIGEGGIFIETDMVQQEGLDLGREMIIELEVELLGHGGSIRPRGEIIWISKKSRSPQKKRNGIGIKFIHISAQEKRAISIFISKEMLVQSELLEKAAPFVSREQKSTDRQRRNLQILDAIRKNRLVSRAEISKNTNINIVTVSNYIDSYLKKGLVFERGLDISSGGRRPELIEINPQYGYVLGVDSGRLNQPSPLMQVVVTDFTTRELTRASATREGSSFEDIQDALKDLIREVLLSEQVEKKKIRGIGMSFCGIMDKFGGTVCNPLDGSTVANYVTIKKELEGEFGLPVFIENSANCALFAESWLGASLEVKAADDIVYIFSDSQCAIMLKGELYAGASRSAGQMNFALPRNHLSSNGEMCWMNPSFDCILRAGTVDFARAAESKEGAFSEGAKLGAKIAYLVNILNPQVVIIAGHFCRLGDSFLDGIRRTVNRWSFRESANLMRIIPATLGDEACALGAASLVIETVFTNI